MSFNKFKLLHETADKFHLEHPSGKKFEVHKSKLSPAAMKKIQELSDGGGVKSLRELPAAQEDILGVMHGAYPDTGRVASSPGERLDSVLGAPVRAGIKAAQEGRFADVPSEMYQQFNVDPRTTVPPTGEELVKAAGITNPYLAKGLGLGLEIASDPSTYVAGRMPTPGVVGEVINASKRFPKKATAAQTKKIEKAVEQESPAIIRTTPAIGKLTEIEGKKVNEMQQSLLERYADRPDVAKHLKKIEGKPFPYSADQKMPHNMPNFAYEAGDVIGNPGIKWHIGGGVQQMAEPLPWMDTKFEITKNALKNRKEPVTINTSSDLIARDDYLEALPKGSTINIYALSDNEQLNRLLFPGNPSQERLRIAAQKLKDAGVNVNVIYPTPQEFLAQAKAAKPTQKTYVKQVTGASDKQLLKELEESTNEAMKAGERPFQIIPGKKPIKEAHGGMIPGYVDGGTVQSFSPVPGPAPTPSPEPIPSVDASNVVSEALNVKPETIYSEEQRQADLEQKIKNRTDVLSAAMQARQFGQELTPEQQASIGNQVRQELIGEQKAQQVIGQAETQQARDMLVKENQQRVALGLPPKPLPPGFAPDQQMIAEGQARALPGTAPSVSPLTEKMRTMGDVFTMQELGAEKALGQIDEGLRRTQKAYDDYILDMKAQQVLDTPQDIAARYREKDDALIKYLDENQINPDRYMQNMSTGNRILSAIGLILGGAGGGASGRNVALDTLNRAIDHDIRAQELDRSEKMNLLKMNREMMADEIQANVATRNQMFSLAQAKIQQAQAMTSNAQTKLQLLGLYADIEKQKAQNRLQLALLQGGQGSDSLENADPSRLVGMMIQNPADRATAFKEVQAAQNTVKMKKAIMESFEQAAKENTVLKTGAGFIRTPGSVLALHQHMMPTFVDLEGSATEGKIHATLKNITPQPGDTEYTVGQKRRMLLEYLQSKASAPVTNAYGINLQNFASTSHNPVMSMSPRERQYYNYAMRYPNSPVSIDFKRKMGIE